MSTACDVTAKSQRFSPRYQHSAQWRWLALGTLLLVELLVFTVRFDTQSIEDVDAAWAALLGQVWLVGRFAVSIAVALVVFGGRRVPDAWERHVKQGPFTEFSWLALLIHAAAALAFFRLSATVFEGGLPSSNAALPWVATWCAAGILTIASWCVALMPLSFWRALFHRARGILLVGAAMAVAAMVAAKIAEYFWPLLCGPTLSCVEAILRLIYSDVVVYREELEIGARSFTAIIGPECSGFEGIGLIGAFIGAFLWSFRSRLQFPQALGLLPLGMGVIWCANVLRIAALVVIGASFSEPVALGGFHSQAGWLAFNAVALGIVYVAWNARVIRAADTQEPASAERYEYAAGPYLLPLLMLVAVMMITTAMSAEGFDWLYPVRVAAALGAMAFFWSTYKDRGYFSWSWSWTPLLIGAAVFAMWMALESLAGVGPQANVEQSRALASLSPAVAALWIAFRAVGSIIAVPLAEELAFRGFLMRKLVADDFENVPLGKFTWYSLLASSILFGLLHGRWLAGTLAGVLFALALYRRGRLMDAIVAHATANAMITAYVLLTGNWASWS